jgi:hypothetical protein
LVSNRGTITKKDVGKAEDGHGEGMEFEAGGRTVEVVVLENL